MDINLPGISGIEALKILREDPETAHIPVVALSANAMPRDIERGLAAGFFRYLTKPIRVDEFMKTLDVALEFAEQNADGACVLSSADILNAKILVVDDKPDNVRLIEGMLRIAGYTCVESTTDPDAVCELYRRNRYSLILLDLQMPGMDGFEVMEGLKEIEGDGYLPVLVITAQPAHKLRALEAGAKDFVGKPFDMAELRARVHNILEVRLLHLKRNYSKVLEETVRELEASREVIRLKTLAEEEKTRGRTGARAANAGKPAAPVPAAFRKLSHPRLQQSNALCGRRFLRFPAACSGQWAGVLADVSGKGMPAALLSSMVLGALSSEFRAGTEPCEALNRINRLVCDKSFRPVLYALPVHPWPRWERAVHQRRTQYGLHPPPGHGSGRTASIRAFFPRDVRCRHL